MHFKKRGLSEVVSTVIIILLVLVAIGIIWAVVQPTLKNATRQVGTDCFTISLQTTCVKNIDTVAVLPNVVSYNFTVSRGTGAGALVGLRFLLSDGTNTLSIQNSSVSGLDELSSKTYTSLVRPSGISGDPAKTISVKIAAEIQNKLCDPLNQPIICA